MNNPFDYTPSEQMLQAQQTLINHIESLRTAYPEFRKEVDKGKMFGILLTDINNPHNLQNISLSPSRGSLSLGEGGGRGLLFAFSGQIADRYDWDGFVPPVFDYLAPDGYFKTHEAEITNINKKVYELEHAPERQRLTDDYHALKTEAEADIESYRIKMKAAKTERDLLRSSGYANDATLTKESQFMKAELHRRKLHWRELLEQFESKINDYEAEIRHLKLQRQHKSDALQRWLFQQFVFTNQQGEQRSLMDLSYPMTMPPSGSGECCEPKLLNYAFTNNLQPIEMGMFWWGESPCQEIRHHLQFYPACSGKCKPILEFLTSPPSPLSPQRGGVNTLEGENENLCNLRNSLIKLETVFEDESIIVVNKPAGLLSVPGKSNAPSVFSILKAQHPELPELQMVHRLDMDTSGLLVVAKTKSAHKHLQRQFAEHTIYKEYIAVLENGKSNVESRATNAPSFGGGWGEVSLPLRPDYEDRPRQLVDHAHGHVALTRYEFLDDNTVKLIPETGRTHQLRVHCAHREGLGRPIKGDRLYGTKSDRLYLHAATLEFTHPKNCERLSFHADPEF